jgi:hypothetical protein
MKQKNEFMLLFRYEPNSNYVPTEAELNAMHQQWGSFIGKIAIQEKLVSTHQLGFEGVQISASKRTKKGIHVANNQTLGGNMIVKARTLAEATELAKDCPVLAMGGSVEVRSIQPM